MNRSIIISSVLHALLIFVTAMSLPFLAKKPLDIPPIVSVELIQIAEKTNIPFAPKAKKIIEKVKEKEKKLVSEQAPPKKVEKTKTKTVLSPEKDIKKIENFISDHWKGKLTLARSFWFVGFVIAFIFLLPLLYADYNYQNLSTGAVYFFLLYVPILLMENIMKDLNENEVCEILNEIMEYELAGVVRYTHSSLMVSGPNRIPIVEFLQTQANESLLHAQQAGELITGLDGHPSQKLAKIKESNRHSIQDILNESLEHEVHALNLYKKLLACVEDASVYLEEYTRGMIGQEEQHSLELKKMLKDFSN